MGKCDIKVRYSAALKNWWPGYASVTAMTASYRSILNAATLREGIKPACEKVSIFREELKRMFLLIPYEAWRLTFSILRRISFSLKHHLADPSLAARLVGIAVQDLEMKGNLEAL